MEIIKIIFKNLFRHPLRNTLTMLGIAIAVSAFGLLATVLTSWDAGMEAASVDRLITRQAISFIFPLPLSYRDKVAHTEGVQEICALNWFGGVYKDPKNFFPRMACEPETIFDVYPEYQITKNELETFKKERNACVVGESIAQQFGFKVGDVMQVEGDIFPGTWDFKICAIYKRRDKNTDGTQMFFNWQYLNERLLQESPDRANEIGWIVSKLKPGANAATVSEAIDSQFRNSPAETKSETERAFNQSFVSAYGAIFTAIRAMSYIIVIIILFVLGNTMIMSARERTREFAMLKTLGFSGMQLSWFIAGEAIVMSLLGSVVGTVLLFGMVYVVGELVPKQFFPIFFVAKSTIITAALSAIVVGLLASIQPIVRTRKMKIVDGLRFIG